MRKPDRRKNKHGQVVRFGAAGATNLAGILVGQGPNGVVLVHPDIGSLCMWLPYGLGLAQLGYRVLAFDLPGHGASRQQRDGSDAPTATAAEWLRGQGASKIFLIGAAEGATFAAVAATRIKPPVNGLVSLFRPSAPRRARRRASRTWPAGTGDVHRRRP